ncbi:hypothetical protein BSPWISOXPB_3715 [uncultured Gammaproteobacteria bacterium]|nr:hypothetical protein BSPWISOXPB_3715 [uncultured Gammaproteobacteria bacterium]
MATNKQEKLLIYPSNFYNFRYDSKKEKKSKNLEVVKEYINKKNRRIKQIKKT